MDPLRISLETAAPRSHEALLALERLLDTEGPADDLLRQLVKTRTSQLTGCAPSLDAHTAEALRLGERPGRLNQLAGWRDSRLFSPGERAALALAEAVTLLAAGGVPDEVYDQAEALLGPHTVATVIVTVAIVNALDRTRIAARFRPPPSQHTNGTPAHDQ